MSAPLELEAQSPSRRAAPHAAPGGSAAPRPAAEVVPLKRRRTPRLIAALVALALVVTAVVYLVTRGTESTDDAQVEGRVANVATRLSGQVLRVHVRDNQTVEPGEVLVELDPADFAARLQAARADLNAAHASAAAARAALGLAGKTAPAVLEQARGGLTSAASSVQAADSAIALARADVAAAQSRRDLAALNLTRARTLLTRQVVAQADVDAKVAEDAVAQAALQQAQARLGAAQAALKDSGGGLAAARGRVSGAATAEEQLASARAAVAQADARVEQAEAAVKLAELNLSYTTVRAARRGVVSRRTVEEGQWVSPERPLMALVPLDDVWVVANFKEDQLAEMHAGLPATVQFDTYGSREFAAHVESLGGGTGARFALLPPDNATGNFIKVVQRVPVLLRLDGNPGVELRPGMSADVTVRTAAR